MTVLLLIQQYAPAFGPRFFRWSALIKQLHSHGLEFDIIDSLGYTREPRKITTLDEPSYSAFRRLVLPLCKKMVFPDKSILSLPRLLYNAEKIIRQHRPTCLIATALPIAPLLAGALLKKRHPNLKFIAEYSDPYSFNSDYRISPRWFKRFDAPLDRFIMRLADTISVHTEPFRQKLIETGMPSRKIVLTRQFFDMEINTAPVEIFREENINLFYGGTFYKEIRNPQFFLNAFSAEPKTNFRLFLAGRLGTCQDIVTEAIARDRRIVYLGMLDRSIILNMLKHADYAINFCNKGELQLPSKLQEIAALSPRVINLYEDLSQRLERNGIMNIPYRQTDMPPLFHSLTKRSSTDAISPPDEATLQGQVREQTDLMFSLIGEEPVSPYYHEKAISL